MSQPKRRRASKTAHPNPASYVENFAAGKWSLAQRASLTLLNLARRFPGHDCCGHYGEPGC